jgi:hypothetical protein
LAGLTAAAYHARVTRAPTKKRPTPAGQCARDPALRTFGLSWPVLMGVAAFLIPVLAPGVLNDPDTYWHIAAGQWMLEHHQVPMHDPFSYSMPGAPWSTHEWGTELLIALLYRLAGWPGLVLLTATSFGLAIGGLTRFLLARLEPLHALALAWIVLSMLAPDLLARPHVVVWPLTVLWVGTLLNANESGRAPPWWLLAVLLLWVNLHSSFVMGLGVAAALGADATLSAAPAVRWQVARAWGWFVVAASALTLMNPHGYGVIPYTFDVLRMKSSLAVIAEWQPPNFQRPQVLTLWLLVILALGFAGRSRLPPIRALLVMGLLYISLQHERNVALLGLISALIMARPLAAQLRTLAAPGADVGFLDRLFAALAAPARLTSLSGVWLLAGVAALAMMHFTRPQPAGYATPDRALDALLAVDRGGRILNAYNFGGYLIFRGIPVFIDGRADMYGDKFVDEYYQALMLSSMKSGLETLLEKYRIDSTLIPPDTPAVHLLDHLPGWHRIYADEVAVVHVRSTPPGAPAS